MTNQNINIIQSGYRPWLDGLRAVAIILVLFEHSNKFKQFHLGAAGVGLFFALSGYLISGLLLKELLETNKICLIKFYLKRFARLAPGLVISVVVCAFIFFFLGMKRAAFNSLFALTYTTNYAAILYGHHLSGFGHTWSLAVEEHFYIFWPLLMGIVFHKYGLKGLSITAFTISVCSFLWRIVLEHYKVNELLFYCGTIERLDAIMYGSCIMLLMAQGFKPKFYHLILGLFLVIFFIVDQIPYPDIFDSAIVGISGAFIVASLDSKSVPLMNKILSNKFFVKIGLLSYSLYLWHLPIFQITDHFMQPSWIKFFVAISFTLLISIISYNFFEMPIRNWYRKRSI